MGLYILLYYVLNLIEEGQKWQYQNATCTNKKPRLYFTILQFIAIALGITFVIVSPEGIENTIVDTLLSSLSIMTGFFLALLVFIYDKYMLLGSTSSTQRDQIEQYKNQNYLIQFNALTSYAIFISMIVIVMLIGMLLFSNDFNLDSYKFTTNWEEIDVLLSIKILFVCIFRFSLIYFLLDFFIISLYAVCSLFQFVNVRMNKHKISYDINKEKVYSDKKILKDKYPKKLKLVYFLLIVFLSGIVIYYLG